MFSETYKSIFSKKSLECAALNYKKHPDYGPLLQMIKSGTLIEMLEKGSYIPGAGVEYLLPKHEGGTRVISVGQLADRVIQKVIVEALQSFFKFSDKSYAYRIGKGPAKAIHRVLDFINRGNFWVARTDISAFFDSIDQEQLSQLLQTKIKDQQLVSLIAMFYKNGVMKQLNYHEQVEGIHQGDPLSPFLSNLYLDSFDRLLEKEKIDFVRYGDDMVLMGKDKKNVVENLNFAKNALAQLNLNLKQEKTVIANIAKGFEYLGIYLHNHTVRMELYRLSEKVKSLKVKTRHMNLYQSIKLINEHIRGFLAYYNKVLTDFSQLNILQKTVDDIITAKISAAKKHGDITRQAEFKNMLSPLQNYKSLDERSLRQYQNRLITSAYALARSEHPIEEASRKIEKKKREIFKDQYASTELILAKVGLYLGFSRGRAVVKERGKIIKSLPINAMTRVVVLSQVSLSSEIIYQCARKGVDIDFIRKNEPYAMISFHRQVSHPLHRRQHDEHGSERFLGIAKTMIRAKIKNQINLLKYFSRYRQLKDIALHQRLITISGEMEIIAKKLHHQHSKEVIRGLEGSCSALYWHGFALLIGDEEHHRITRDAPDAVNQALNYGYAILYNRVQSALLRARLDIYSPLFHEPRENKPTLVYDLIEEFRQSVVDREVIAIVNHHQKLSTSKGHLTQESVKIVTEHIQSRLSGLTRYQGKKFRFEDVISSQALLLAKAIKNEKKYRAFVNRF